MARDARKRKSKRRGLQIGLGIPAAIAVVFGLVWLLGDNDDNSDSPTVAESTAPSLDIVSTDPAAVPTTAAGIIASGPLPCPAVDGTSEKVAQFVEAPPECLDPGKTYVIEVDTSQGSYTAELDAEKAPITVNSFVYLARYHYFDGITCHRVVPDFVVQCGDPTASGSGGPGYSFADELPAAGEYKLGSLAMANSGANTNGSQFFVISGDNGIALPPKYSLFGQVTEGLETIAAINALAVGDGAPSETVTINSVTVTEAGGASDDTATDDTATDDTASTTSS